MEELDNLYYRNRVALKNTRGLSYKTFRTYTSCDESQVKITNQTSRNEFDQANATNEKPNINFQTKIVGI